MQERRKQVRVNVQLLGKYALVQGATASVQGEVLGTVAEGEVHNVSAGGVLLSTSRPLPLAANVRLDVEIPGGGTLFERDPDAFDNPPSRPSGHAMMGDIVRTAASEIRLAVRVVAHAPIERIEIRNGQRPLAPFRPYAPEDPGARVRGAGGGAEDPRPGRHPRPPGAGFAGPGRIRARPTTGPRPPREQRICDLKGI